MLTILEASEMFDTWVSGKVPNAIKPVCETCKHYKDNNCSLLPCFNIEIASEDCCSKWEA